MKIFQSKIIISFILLFSFFINSSDAMHLADFKFNDFDQFDGFLRTDYNSNFFIKILWKGQAFLKKTLFETDRSSWFAEPTEYEPFDYYAERLSIDEKGNVIVIGDLHGNYEALYQIIQNLIDRKILSADLKIKTGYKIVSLGDYIDRGSYSAQVLSFLIILKLINPDDYIMLRGNHEKESLIYSIISHLNSKNKNSIEYLKHYDFISNILRKFLVKGKRSFVTNKMRESFSFIKTLFINFFSLLPTVFYLQASDKTFMFNHAGYAENYLFETQILSQFLNPDFKYAFIEIKDAAEALDRELLLLGDIFSERIFDEKYMKSSDKKMIDRRIKKLQDELSDSMDFLDPDLPDEYLDDNIFTNGLEVRVKKLGDELSDLKSINSFIGSGGRSVLLDKYVSELMAKSGITAKFFGHTHNLIKTIYKNYQGFNSYYDYQDGFMTIGTKDNLIFNIISGKIYSEPIGVNYNTSYLELIVNGNDWNVTGNSLAQNDEVFKSKPVPYCYDL